MGDVEVSVSAEGAAKAQHDHLGFLVTQVRPEDLERHRAVQALLGIKEAAFIRWLRCCFLAVLAMAVIKFLIFQLHLHPHRNSPPAAWWNYRDNQTRANTTGNFPMGRKGVVLLAVSVAVVVVGVFAKKTKRSAASAQPARQQGQMTSPHVGRFNYTQV